MCQLQQAYRVLKYLKGTSNLGLEFKLHGSPTDINPEIFTDASWGNDLETRRSTSGMLVKFNGNVVCWSTKKQKTVAKSSTESEYMAASEAACEAIWLRTWLKEVFNQEICIKMFCDNQSAIALSKNDTFHQRTKHIDIAYHFIREKVDANQIKIEFVPTKEQQADILTKNLNGGTVFKSQRDRLMVKV
jgi:hypothetical protein